MSPAAHAAWQPAPSTVQGWQKILDTPANLTNNTTNDHEVYALLEHRGLLYIGYYTAGIPNSRRAARLYTWDGTTQTLKYTFGTGLAFASLQALGEYRGNLYAGISGLAKGDGDIYVSKDGGTTWAKSYDTTMDYFCSTLVVFNDKLYAGMGYASSRITAFDGKTWKVVYPGKPGLVEWMYVYKGKLYAALGGPQASNAALVSTSDGITWTVDYEFASVAATYAETASLVEFKGRLYAGMLKGGSSGGDLLVLDDATGRWSVAWSNPNGNRLHAMEVYNGRLYVGNANATGAGDVYVSSDGVTFTKDLDTDIREVFRLYKYNGSLYMGSGYRNGQARIWRKNDSLAFKFALRKILEEESIYARNYIVSGLSNQLVSAFDEERWLKVQDDWAQALAGVYASLDTSGLTALLREHVRIAKEAIAAAKNNAEFELASIKEQWAANADQTAIFLNGVNNLWPKDEIKDLLIKHQQYVIAQVSSRIADDGAAELNSFDLDRFYMLKLADALSDSMPVSQGGVP